MCVILTVLVGVGVTDHGRVLPGLAQHRQTVGGVGAGGGAAVRPATPGTGCRGAGAVPAQHQTVEIQPDLEIFHHTFEFSLYC